MHELAVCHVGGAKHGSAVGFVESYDAGVLVARVHSPLTDQHIGDAVQTIVLDPCAASAVTPASSAGSPTSR